MGLSWRHHTLIQALLSRGPLKQADLQSILMNLSPGGKLNDCVGKINEELGYVHMEVRACKNQNDGSVYYGVVNNVADEQSKLGTNYTVPQITLYKAIIEAIVQDPGAHGSISNIDAFNLRLEDQGAAIRNFTLSHKEKTLDQLIKDKWLSSIPDNQIGLGVRSFLDLRTWFRTNEVPACSVCNEAAVKAECCQNEECNVRIHQYCLKQKFSQKKKKKIRVILLKIPPILNLPGGRNLAQVEG
ncbi:hypothetical protein LIER_19214 [Lithospermum erythrorhizon]|uniref:Non-structural maintenance of chromosomes element 1 homolog n=1 Tax=Lithospermum erythrorhizon TaxID=34254 RepID=A0AAV3QJG9_LITER